MEKLKWKILVVSLLLVYAVAFIGSLFTSGNTNSEWYQSIKPPLTPPNYVFPIVWNVLFFLLALSLYFAWLSAKTKKTKIRLALVFAINLILNVLWSMLFFALKNPKLAFAELLIFWFSILAMIFITWKTSRKSAYLLIPYLLWVSFAGILNYLIVFR